VASLHGGWRWLRYFGILPRVMTDFFYDLIGRYRYRIFGQRDVCLVPDEALRQRFIDDSSQRRPE
jgi:predicted DCC family thiol-disulfide oxidoreductase YuxK